MRNHIRLVVLATAVTVVSGCVTKDEYLKATSTIENQDRIIRNREQDVDGLSKELQRVKAELARQDAELKRAQSNEAALRTSNDKLSATLGELQSQLGGIEGVSMEQIAGGVQLVVAGEVLFDTGQSAIKPSGENVLLKIAQSIKSSGKRIVVAGHTDNVPVKHTRDKYPRGNLELSGERALTVADYLITRGGIEANRVSFSGYGEWRPKAGNTDEQGRRKNRRVEIQILDEEDIAANG